jgi:hypothetical protein
MIFGIFDRPFVEPTPLPVVDSTLFGLWIEPKKIAPANKTVATVENALREQSPCSRGFRKNRWTQSAAGQFQP